MSKRIKLRLWILTLAVGLCGFIAHHKASALIAEPTVRLVFGSQDCPVSSLLKAPRPGKGRLDTILAFDQTNGFYFVTNQRDAAYEKQVAHPPHADIINVLSVRDNVKKVVPLKRKDGRFVRYLSDFLSVSPSGKRWWTARRPYESPSDLQEGSNPMAILTAYDESGTASQEWTLPQTINEIRLLQAVGEDRVYVVIDDIGDGAERQQVWVYRIGNTQPQQKVPCPLFEASSGAFITSEGRLWSLQSGVNGSIQVLQWSLDSSPQVSVALRQNSKNRISSLFWHDPSQGVFTLGHSQEDRTLKPRGTKTIYNLKQDGALHKLFETPDVLPRKPGEEARVGQLLKANAAFVWMEVEYLKDKRVTEYQIVKVPYHAS